MPWLHEIVFVILLTEVIVSYYDSV